VRPEWPLGGPTCRSIGSSSACRAWSRLGLDAPNGRATWLAADEERWRAYLGGDDLDEPPEVVFCCRDWAEREFGAPEDHSSGPVPMLRYLAPADGGARGLQPRLRFRTPCRPLKASSRSVARSPSRGGRVPTTFLRWSAFRKIRMGAPARSTFLLPGAGLLADFNWVPAGRLHACRSFGTFRLGACVARWIFEGWRQA
jgi:hypothetical protein